MKYSVIIPTYNSVSFMKPVFDFIERQHRSDIEFIFVDDCSEDNTFEFLSSYIKTSSSLISIYRNEKNSGPGIARNLGMRNAIGDWIVFLDSDDSLVIDFFERIDSIIKVNSPDCIFYDSEVYNRNNIVIQRPVTVYGKGEGFLSVEDAISYAIPGIRKCFKRNLVLNDKVLFNSFKRGEDLIFYSQLYVSKPGIKLYYTKQNLYLIHQRNGSLSNGSETYNIMPKVYSYLRGTLPSEYQSCIDVSSVRMLLYGGVLQMSRNNDSNEDIIKFIEDYEHDFPEWYHSEGFNVLGKVKKVFLFFIKKRWLIMIHFFVKIHKFYTTR